MSLDSIIKPLRPSQPGWDDLGDATFSPGYPCHRWYHARSELLVLSAVEVAKDKDGIDRGPEYHVSVSKFPRHASKPRRCSSDEAQWMLAQFGLAGAEEDNHVPNGVVRNFWRTVAEPLIGLECGCKADEPAMREDKGDFIWRG